MFIRRNKTYSKGCQSNRVFFVSVFCMIVGILVRLFYCVLYPVQPRDAYVYGAVISQLKETGKIPAHVSYYPLSLWILKIPHQLFNYDSIKGGIIVNMLLGLLIIAIVVYFISRYFKNIFSLIFVGLLAATHPSLVRFSCSCLRENSYLFFFLLVLMLLSSYSSGGGKLFSIVLAGIFGACAFLCRLEGLEIVGIVFIVMFIFFLSKRLGLSKAACHFCVFLIVFSVTAFSIYYFLGARKVSQELIMSKIDFESLN